MKIRLLATADVHGVISPYQYSDRTLAQQGLARLAGHIHRLHDENTLLIDNGDVLEGCPLTFYHAQYEPDTHHPMADALNYLKYDYYNLGNHDFNYGYDMQHGYMEAVHAKCITGNITEHGKVVGAEYTIHEFDETHRIALIGVTTQHIPVWEHPEHIEHNTFENVFDYVKRTVAKIKETESVNGIVVVYHGGFEKDLETGVNTEAQTGENLGYKMCAEIDGIDVMITGHQHRSLATKCFDKVVTQTAYIGKELAVVEWDLDTHEITAELLKADQPIDENLMALFAEKEERVQTWLDEPLGIVKDGDLLIDDLFEARVHKHPLVSFLNQVQLHVSGAQLSANALFNDAKGFRHEITMRDLVSTYVYPNTLMVLKMPGNILKEYIEKCAEYFAINDGKLGVSHRFEWPKPQHYNYDMVEGVDYVLDIRKPEGQRLVSLTYQGKEVEDTDEFTMVVSNYRGGGGGNFDMVKKCEVIKTIQDDMVSCMAAYLKENPELVVNHRENIKIIY